VSVINGVSIEGLQSAFDALSNRISAAVAGVASVTSDELSQQISLRSAADAALSVRADSIYFAVSVLSGKVEVLSINHSVLSALVFTNVSANSTAGVTKHGLQSAINALSSRISNGVSLIVQEANIRSAADLSLALADVSLDIRMSALVRAKFLSVETTTSAAAGTLVTIATMFLTLSASTMYEIEAMLLYSTNSAVQFGLEFPGLKGGGGLIQGNISAGTSGQNQSVVNMVQGRWGAADSNSIILSIASVGTNGFQVVRYTGGFLVSATTGNLQLKVAGSTGSGRIIIGPGSYMRVMKIGVD
jgi:hypothetical protein